MSSQLNAEDEVTMRYLPDSIEEVVESSRESIPGMVMAIRKPHSRAILEKTKEIEFRRTPLKESNAPDVGIIYEPSPTQSIIGTFSVECIDQRPIGELCELAQEHTPSTEESIRTYFDGKQTGTAIFIGEVQEIDPAIPLRNNAEGDWAFTPPQNFYYVNAFSFLENLNSLQEKSDKPGGESQQLGDS